MAIKRKSWHGIAKIKNREKRMELSKQCERERERERERRKR